MRDGWRSVAFGDVARVDIERERVSPEKEYPTAGVLNAGQGMFDRGILPGRVTNYSFLHRLRAGQVVMRKLTAWEGPVTVVPSEFDRFCVSTEFPTFTLNQEYILPEFMRLICQRPSFWLALKERSTGTVQRRKRVSPSALLTVPILLPHSINRDELLTSSRRSMLYVKRHYRCMPWPQLPGRRSVGHCSVTTVGKLYRSLE